MTRQGKTLLETFSGRQLPSVIIFFEIVFRLLLVAIVVPYVLAKLGVGQQLALTLSFLLMAFWIRFYVQVFQKSSS